MKPNEHRSDAERFLENAKVPGMSPDKKKLNLLFSIAHAALAGPEEEIIHAVSGDTPGEALDRARAVQVRQVLIDIMRDRLAPVRGDESLDDLIEAEKRTRPKAVDTTLTEGWEQGARAEIMISDSESTTPISVMRDWLYNALVELDWCWPRVRGLHHALAEIDRLRETLADRDGRLADRNRELARLRGDDDAV